MSLFDDQTPAELRAQILTYFATSVMSDGERARVLGLPRGCRIREGAKILNQGSFQCGEYVWIGEGAILDAQGGLAVGDYTQIGPNVMVWSHSSHMQALHGETGITRERITYTPTTIGKNCFIAGPSVILPGITIGDRVLVPPMSVVDRDLPDNTMYRSTNARLEKFENRVAELERALAALGGGK